MREGGSSTRMVECVPSATVPIWTLYLTPASPFVGAMVGQWATRRGAIELEQRSRREEVMRSCGGRLSLPWTTTMRVRSSEWTNCWPWPGPTCWIRLGSRSWMPHWTRCFRSRSLSWSKIKTPKSSSWSSMTRWRLPMKTLRTYHQLRDRGNQSVMAMAKQVYVTAAQKKAAKAVVERSAAKGRVVSASVRKIADAPSKSVTRGAFSVRSASSKG
jgi:hypothetical protein